MVIEGVDDCKGNAQPPTSGAAISGAVTQPDPLAAFVASLNPEQRAKLVSLLSGG